MSSGGFPETGQEAGTQEHRTINVKVRRGGWFSLLSIEIRSGLLWLRNKAKEKWDTFRDDRQNRQNRRTTIDDGSC